jgi:hypothetical protein
LVRGEREALVLHHVAKDLEGFYVHGPLINVSTFPAKASETLIVG